MFLYLGIVWWVRSGHWPQKVPVKQALVKSALVHKADLWNCTG